MEVKATRKIGDVGESLACDYLQAQGYTVLCRNYATRHGELDIVARKGEILAFVEVKTRTQSPTQGRYGRPATAMTRQKWEHILFAARAYLATQGEVGKPRLDVIEVYLYPDRKTAREIRHYPAAYTA